MENNQQKRFLYYILKIDSKNIVLKYKLKKIYNKKIFYIEKINIIQIFILFVIAISILFTFLLISKLQV